VPLDETLLGVVEVSLFRCENITLNTPMLKTPGRTR
jgi:hypothetical protein